MEQRYSDAVSCLLSAKERRVPTTEETTPLVIKPLKSKSRAFLREFLHGHSAQITEDISRHGAVLLRGFDIESAKDFEQQILSIQGMQGMGEYLLIEDRHVLDDTRYVLNTSSAFKTGGALHFGAFHSENYYTPDVPRYISFFCRRAGVFGGETGLVNLVKMYADLPDTTKRKLEEKTCLVCLVSIAKAAKFNGMDADRAAEFFRNAGLPLAMIDGVAYVAIYKPSVVQHPTTHERALLVGFGYVDGLRVAVLNAFRPDYRGPRWLLHRLLWRAPARLLPLYLRILYPDMIKLTQASANINITKASSPLAGAHTLTLAFTAEELRLLATLTRRHYSSFTWKPGDVLIIDNLKMAHNGMPGLGNREIQVMLCNPLLIAASATSPGLHIARASDVRSECMGAQFARARMDPEAA